MIHRRVNLLDFMDHTHAAPFYNISWRNMLDIWSKNGYILGICLGSGRSRPVEH